MDSSVASVPAASGKTVTVGPFTAELVDVKGKVIDVQIWTETHVAGGGGGGGGFVAGGTGSISSSSISISSSNSKTFRAFIQLDGREIYLDFDETFPLRTGNTIVFRSFTFNGEKFGGGILNAEQGTCRVTMGTLSDRSPDIEKMEKEKLTNFRKKLKPGAAIAFAIVFIGCLIYGFPSGTGWWGALVGIGVLSLVIAAVLEIARPYKPLRERREQFEAFSNKLREAVASTPV